MSVLGIILGATPQAHAEKPAGGDLSDFFKLDEKLPGAVCDESVISRAPALKLDRESGPDLRVEASASEAELIRFLLGDAATPVVSPKLAALWETTGKGSGSSLAEAKRKVSLEICTSLINPGGKLKTLFQSKPAWMFQGYLTPSKGENVPAPGTGRASLTLKDVEGRYGFVGGKWWVGGWVEPFEVISADTASREYRRLANPVTNQTQFVQVTGKDSLPLGFLSPSDEVAKLDWETLKVRSESEATRQRKIATYKLMIEIEAYRAFNASPSKVEKIRKLQEFYRSLISAYQIYPEESQFAQYAKKARGILNEKDIRRVLNDKFFEAVTAARVNGSRVAFHLFMPDAKLHGMFLEYRERLNAI